MDKLLRKFINSVEDPMWADHYEGSKIVGREIISLIRTLNKQIQELTNLSNSLKEQLARKKDGTKYKKILDSILESKSEDPKVLKGMADYKLLEKNA